MTPKSTNCQLCDLFVPLNFPSFSESLHMLFPPHVTLFPHFVWWFPQVSALMSPPQEGPSLTTYQRRPTICLVCFHHYTGHQLLVCPCLLVLYLSHPLQVFIMVGAVVLPSHLKKKGFFSLSSFRFTEKLSGKYRELPFFPSHLYLPQVPHFSHLVLVWCICNN